MPSLGVIDAILADDQNQPKKQRHTAKRIFDRFREEHGHAGSYTTVKKDVRRQWVWQQEMFVPLAHTPSEAQADFGEAHTVGLQCAVGADRLHRLNYSTRVCLN